MLVDMRLLMQIFATRTFVSRGGCNQQTYLPKAFAESYPGAGLEVVTPENYWDFVCSFCSCVLAP